MAAQWNEHCSVGHFWSSHEFGKEIMKSVHLDTLLGPCLSLLLSVLVTSQLALWRRIWSDYKSNNNNTTTNHSIQYSLMLIALHEYKVWSQTGNLGKRTLWIWLNCTRCEQVLYRLYVTAFHFHNGMLLSASMEADNYSYSIYYSFSLNLYTDEAKQIHMWKVFNALLPSQHKNH